MNMLKYLILSLINSFEFNELSNDDIQIPRVLSFNII